MKGLILGCALICMTMGCTARQAVSNTLGGVAAFAAGAVGADPVVAFDAVAGMSEEVAINTERAEREKKSKEVVDSGHVTDR